MADQRRLQVQAPSYPSLVRGRLDHTQYPGVEPGPRAGSSNQSLHTLPWLAGWLAGRLERCLPCLSGTLASANMRTSRGQEPVFDTEEGAHIGEVSSPIVKKPQGAIVPLRCITV